MADKQDDKTDQMVEALAKLLTGCTVVKLGECSHGKANDPIIILAGAAKKDVSIGTRIRIIQEVIDMLRDPTEENLKNFGGAEKLAVALKDLQHWRDLIKRIDKSETTLQLVLLFENNWDSTQRNQVKAPDSTQTGAFVREAFLYAWQDQITWIVQGLAFGRQRRLQIVKSTSTTTAAPSKEEDKPKEKDDESDGESDIPPLSEDHSDYDSDKSLE